MKDIGLIRGSLTFIIPRLADNAWDRLCLRDGAKELKIILFEEKDILSFLEETPKPERVRRLLEKTVMKNMGKCSQ